MNFNVWGGVVLCGVGVGGGQGWRALAVLGAIVMDRGRPQARWRCWPQASGYLLGGPWAHGPGPESQKARNGRTDGRAFWGQGPGPWAHGPPNKYLLNMFIY